MAGKKGKAKVKARVFTRPKLQIQPPLTAYANSGIHDSEPTRNVKELHFAIYDWFTITLPKVPPTGSLADFVYSYGIEETQNFLGQVTDNPSGDDSDRGTGITKNRIKTVTLEILSPEKSIEVSAGTGNLTKQVSLPLVVSGVPTPTSIVTLPSPSPNAIIGQNSTVVHPDVRSVVKGGPLGLANDVQRYAASAVVLHL